jgi:hypothetical protein
MNRWPAMEPRGADRLSGGLEIGADEFMAELRPLDDNAVASVSP